MKSFIFILTLAIFLQASFLPVNLVLLLLISRALIKSDKANYYLALYGGILYGLLTSSNIGFYSIILILFVQIIEILKKSRLSTHPLTVLIVIAIANLVLTLIESLFFHQQILIQVLILTTVLALPVYGLMRIWEERFVPDRAIRLKI